MKKQIILLLTCFAISNSLIHKAHAQFMEGDPDDWWNDLPNDAGTYFHDGDGWVSIDPDVVILENVLVTATPLYDSETTTAEALEWDQNSTYAAWDYRRWYESGSHNYNIYYYHNYTPYNNPPPQTDPTFPAITDNINNTNKPCIDAGLGRVNKPSLSSPLMNTLSRLLYSNRIDIEIEFGTGNLASTVDGNTNTDNIHPTAGGGLSAHHTITINNSLETSASREYMVATVLHELVHAYINTIAADMNINGNYDPIAAQYHQLRNSGMNSDDASHEVMADNFIYDMAGVLRTIFPNLSQTDAEELAWGGLQGFGNWNLLTSTQKNNINNENIAHKNGTKGTPC